MKKLTLLFILISFATLSKSQVDPENLSSVNYRTAERMEILSGSLKNDLHFTMRPLTRKVITDYALYLDTVNTMLLTEQDQYNLEHIFLDNNDLVPESHFATSPRPVLKHFYKTPAHLFDLHTDDIDLQINPIFYGNVSYDNKNSDGYGFINTRGASVRATIDKKVSLYSILTENQVVFPEFMRMRADSLGVVPGKGFYQREGTQFDYFEPKAGLSVDATKHINVQLGYDKHFIGDGYRSLLLSENANNAAFLKFNTKFWKVNYTNLYQELVKENTQGPDTLAAKKYQVSHHLSFDVNEKLNIGIFETIIFARENQFEFHYLNPVIFFRAIEQQVGSPDNVLIGANYSALVKNRFKLYGQLVLDEFRISDIRNGKSWANKFGFQQGVKYINAFDVNNLDLQAEVNRVRPYTYSHNNLVSNYTNYGQALAHPLGANFTEINALAHYQPFDKLRINGMVSFANYGRDSDERSWGGDIINKTFRNRPFDDDVKVGQGWTNKSLNIQGRASYEMKHNLNLDVQGVYKRLSSDNQADFNNLHIGAGIRWNFGAYDYNY